MSHTIDLDGRQVAYELIRKQVKNVNLRVKADGTVWVSAPLEIPAAEIEAMLQSRKRFLLQALDRFAEQRALAPEDNTYPPGGVFWLLGRSYPIAVYQGQQEAGFLKNTFCIVTPDPANPAQRIQTAETFLREECLALTTILCRRYQKAMAPFGVPMPEIKIRSMTSRWGICRPAARQVTFALQLVRAPVECVEYVVCHELAHFIYPNHSKAFHDCVASFLPDWKELEKQLQVYGGW